MANGHKTYGAAKHAVKVGGMVGKGIKKVVSYAKKNPHKAAAYAALPFVSPTAAASLGAYKAYQHYKKNKKNPKPQMAQPERRPAPAFNMKRPKPFNDPKRPWLK
jgi:uncharacterized membrane protein YebE (DUF533 family)